MTEYVFSEEELAEINRIKDTKFGTWDWNYGKSPEFNVHRGTKFTSGKVEVFANVIESKIQDIKIYGDFLVSRCCCSRRCPSWSEIRTRRCP